MTLFSVLLVNFSPFCFKLLLVWLFLSLIASHILEYVWTIFELCVWGMLCFAVGWHNCGEHLALFSRLTKDFSLRVQEIN